MAEETRTPIVGGNWKMNNVDVLSYLWGNGKTIIDFDTGNMGEDGLIALVDEVENVDIFIAPPFTTLDFANRILNEYSMELGTQDMYFKELGAFTGEISAEMLKDVGVKYVIVGHSERRHIIGETNEVVNRKLKAALEADFYGVLCVGETLEQRNGGSTESVIRQQIYAGLNSVPAEATDKLIIAYEPVWAIGTGETAEPEQAQEVHANIRNLLAEKFNPEIANKVRIQYGGSAKPDNAAKLIAQQDIDGFLVGGASMKADQFSHIIHHVQEHYKQQQKE